MVRKIIVLTADKRQEKLVSLLDGEKGNFVWGEVDNCEKIYVLPIPVAKLDQNIIIKELLKQELINNKSNDVEVKVFGGVINAEWKAFLETFEIPYWDFMELPEVVEGNAYITAEATAVEVLQMSECSIKGQKVMITGYGCCGQKIANIFSKLGADVVVVARRSEVRKKAKEDGFSAVDFVQLEKELLDVNTVINTVPSMVLTETCVKTMPKGSIIVDIASKPGGTDFEAARNYKIAAKLALGLPGIYTTTSSANLLKNAISKYAPLKENKGEDQVWIFQVVI